MASQSNKLESIEFLRAVAVIFVVFSHIAHELTGLLAEIGTSFNDKRFPGDFGVDLFFVISGFVMVYTCWDKFGTPSGVANFARRRIIRIVPLYWILTTLMIAVVIVLPNDVNSATDDWRQWISSYLFIPYARESDGMIRPVLGLGWSLQFEMFFYLIFCLSMFLPRRTGLLITISLLVALPVATLALDQDSTLVRFAGHPIIIEFAAGITLGIVYMKRYAIPDHLGMMLAIVGFALLVLAPAYSPLVDNMRHIHYGIPATLIMSAAVLTHYGQNLQVGRIFNIGGEISYAVYLSHPFVIGLVALIFERAGLLETVPPLGLVFSFGTIVMIGALFAGFTIHYWLDKPLTGTITKLWKPFGTEKLKTQPA